MSWVPLHCHSTYSCLDGLSKPEQIAARCVELGYQACALTDHGNVSGVPSFIKEMGKKKLKAISGEEFYLSKDDPTIKGKEHRSLSHLCVLAKDYQGWKNLMKASSAAFHPDNLYYKPRLNLEKLASYSGGHFITFSGHMGSDLADACFYEPKLAYRVDSLDEARGLVRKDWKDYVCGMIRKYQRLFGPENFYVEIQLIDRENLPASEGVAAILRHCAKLLNVPCVATADSHYCRKEDAGDQRLLLCTALNTTMGEVYGKIQQGEDVGLSTFFKSNNYHIPSLEEMRALHTAEELQNTVDVAARCESYEVGRAPLLPTFECPDGKTPDEFLKELCRVGWAKRKINNFPNKKTYQDRLINVEYPVLTKAQLSSYFLIVWDYINYAKEELKAYVGAGRGSSAGSIVAWLLGITNVDPMRYNLLFERFFNAGRLSEGRASLPDIDTDFPVGAREPLIKYLKAKYGHDKVCQMATFSRMQGRWALKDVLRGHNRCTFDEMNLITKHIPDEAAISDELQLMREEGEEASIIRWALINHGEQLKDWCEMQEDGSLEGPLAVDFAQAIRLEGTKRNMGKHASGVIICSEPLDEICPMVYSKSGEYMTGVDMNSSEALGLVKFDILGLNTLDKLKTAENLIRTGQA